MTLRTQFEEAHAAVLRELAELEKVTAAPAPDRALLAATRLKLSRASTQRAQLLDRKILPWLLEKVPPSEAGPLVELRSALAAARARSSEHVIRWTLDQAAKEWSCYCRASAGMRATMRAQIERERTVVGPLLRRIPE
jgi:hypothetical protein